jgi:hypothetical protein
MLQPNGEDIKGDHGVKTYNSQLDHEKTNVFSHAILREYSTMQPE